jgi:hypothetical protein
MSIPIRRWCVFAPLLCCFGFVAPAAAVDLPLGQTSAIFEWDTATGPVEYYYVEVNRNGQGFGPASFRPHPEDPTQKGMVLISGAPGDWIQLRVQAVGSNGDRGEFSLASETVYFLAPIPDPCEGVEDVDQDADGTPDCRDACAADPAKSEAGICGCGVSDQDSDADGTPDCVDTCVADSAKTEPGSCGCGVSDQDSDADGTPDCVDTCVADSAKTEPGICGCGASDRDSDADSTLDCQEACDDDPDKTSPGVCGCGVSDRDSDADGTLDCQETCDDDPDKTSPGDCGCGVSDADDDENGTADCLDAPPDPAKLLDFNKDGNAELLIRNRSTGDIELWLLADSSQGVLQADPLDPSFEIVGNADYDGDGYADLLARNPTTGDLEIRLLENGKAVETRGFTTGGPNWDVVGSADYDSNGYADILLRNRETNEMQFWSIYRTNLREVVVLPDADANAEIIGSGDYDGDGRHDILWWVVGGFLKDSDLFVWYLDDPADPVEEQAARIEWNWFPVGTGDYDGDGTSDVLLQHGQSGDLNMYLFEQSGGSLQSVSDGRRIPRTWGYADYSIVNSADFDGDGSCDIALRHRYGELLLLYMKGPQAVDDLSIDIPDAWSVEGVGLENPASE